MLIFSIFILICIVFSYISSDKTEDLSTHDQSDISQNSTVENSYSPITEINTENLFSAYNIELDKLLYHQIINRINITNCEVYPTYSDAQKCTVMLGGYLTNENKLV